MTRTPCIASWTRSARRTACAPRWPETYSGVSRCKPAGIRYANRNGQQFSRKLVSPPVAAAPMQWHSNHHEMAVLTAEWRYDPDRVPRHQRPRDDARQWNGPPDGLFRRGGAQAVRTVHRRRIRRHGDYAGREFAVRGPVRAVVVLPLSRR